MAAQTNVKIQRIRKPSRQDGEKHSGATWLAQVTFDKTATPPATTDTGLGITGTIVAVTPLPLETATEYNGAIYWFSGTPSLSFDHIRNDITLDVS